MHGRQPMPNIRSTAGFVNTTTKNRLPLALVGSGPRSSSPELINSPQVEPNSGRACRSDGDSMGKKRTSGAIVAVWVIEGNWKIFQRVLQVSVQRSFKLPVLTYKSEKKWKLRSNFFEWIYRHPRVLAPIEQDQLCRSGVHSILATLCDCPFRMFTCICSIEGQHRRRRRIRKIWNCLFVLILS